MWVVAGLGNPGRRYVNTRHNIGFKVLNCLAERFGLKFLKKESYFISKGFYGDEQIILIKPLTFMNLSGIAVKDVLRQLGCYPERLIVVHDDIDLPPGRIKIKKGSSSGGHRGIQSIINHLGTKGFMRVKMGIGRPSDASAEEYVLQKFNSAERKIIKNAVTMVSDAVISIIEGTIVKPQ